MRSRARGRPSVKHLVLVAVVVAAVVGSWWVGIDGDSDEGVEALHERGVSGVVVETEGEVSRLLPEDREGSRHQRFILRLASGHTVLVAHNIDVAPRAPVERGTHVEVRGEYEWNELGGVLHWTHRDRRGRRPGGWIRVGGRVYR